MSSVKKTKAGEEFRYDKGTAMSILYIQVQ